MTGMAPSRANMSYVFVTSERAYCSPQLTMCVCVCMIVYVCVCLCMRVCVCVFVLVLVRLCRYVVHVYIYIYIISLIKRTIMYYIYIILDIDYHYIIVYIIVYICVYLSAISFSRTLPVTCLIGQRSNRPGVSNANAMTSDASAPLAVNAWCTKW